MNIPESMSCLQEALDEAQRVGELLAAHPKDAALKKDLYRIRAAIRQHQRDIRAMEANPHLYPQ